MVVAGRTCMTLTGLRKRVATLLARNSDPQAVADQLGHGSPRVSPDHSIERVVVSPERSGALDRSSLRRTIPLGFRWVDRHPRETEGPLTSVSAG